MLEVVFASNTVPHITSGKAISRAIRGHTLIESALHAILQEDLLKFDDSSQVPVLIFNFVFQSLCFHENNSSIILRSLILKQSMEDQVI